MLREPTRTLVAALGVGLILIGCARNPVTGRPEMVLVSSETEQRVGREEAVKIEATMGLADLASAREYVKRVGARVAAHSPRQDVTYTFDVVDTPEPNAFALPGGPVYVSRGLLALTNSEDELAAVLGHEVGHIAARHVVQRVSVTAPMAVIVGIPSAIVGSVSRSLGDAVAAPGAAALASHSRGQENEADRIGINLAAAAGYDPAALGRILATMERDELLHRETRRRTHFFDSHPATADRVRDTERHAATVTAVAAAPIAADRAATLGKLRGLLVGENPDHGVFLDHRFVHPDLGFSLDFPPDWKTRNQPDLVIGVEDVKEQPSFVVLSLSGEGDDPRAGAVADGMDEALAQQMKVKTVNGLPTGRYLTEQRGATLMLTWIAHGGTVYRVACAGQTSRWPTLGPLCERASGSFRRLASRDRDRIREERLVLETARGGERMTDLVARARSVWSAERAAVANQVDGPDAILPAGRPMKIAVSRPYQGKR